MSVGRVTVGRATVARGVNPAPASTSGFDRVLARPDEPAVFLVEVKGFRGGTFRLGGRAGVGRGVVGRWTIGRGDQAGIKNTSEVTLRWSNRHWVGRPDDVDRPNASFEGRILNPLRITREIPTTPEQSPRIQRQFGSIEIANNDGALEPALSLAVDGRPVMVKYGPASGTWSDMQTISDLLATTWQPGRQSVELLVRDRRFALDQPLQSNLYAGTGGAEGTDDLEGKPKPIALGIVRNASPVLLDPQNLIYQVHNGAIQAVDAVYDRGAELTDSGTDVSGYNALVSQSVTAGEYATALDSGLIKLGGSPDGQITADVQGDADPVYESTIDPIIIRILTKYAGLANDVINKGSFAGLVATGGDVGWYIGVDDRPTSAQVIDALVSGVAGFWGTDRKGRIRAGRLRKPENELPAFTFDQTNTLEITPLERPTPRYRQRVSYQRLWTVQESDIAGTVGDDRRQVLAQGTREVAKVDTDIRVRHREALDPQPLASPLDDKADAETLADRVLDLHKRDRAPVRVTAKRIGFRFDLGAIVRVVWPRYGLQQGKNYVIVGSRDSGDTTELTLWG